MIEIYQPNKLIDHLVADIVVETSQINMFGQIDDVSVCCTCSFSQAEGAQEAFLEKVWYEHNDKRAFDIEADTQHMHMLEIECQAQLGGALNG